MPLPATVESGEVGWLLRELADLRLDVAVGLTMAAAALDNDLAELARAAVDADIRRVEELRRSWRDRAAAAVPIAPIPRAGEPDAAARRGSWLTMMLAALISLVPLLAPVDGRHRSAR